MYLYRIVGIMMIILKLVPYWIVQNLRSEIIQYQAVHHLIVLIRGSTLTHRFKNRLNMLA